jgi:hypothetical protein
MHPGSFGNHSVQSISFCMGTNDMLPRRSHRTFTEHACTPIHTYS